MIINGNLLQAGATVFKRGWRGVNEGEAKQGAAFSRNAKGDDAEQRQRQRQSE